MSLYSREDERAIRVQRLVDDWTKSGLLQNEQRDRISPSLQVDLRRTNTFLRITLFLFAFLIVTAIGGLAVIFLESVLTDSAVRWFALADAAICFMVAAMLVRRYRLYHFGIEEAVVIGGAMSFAVFMAEFTDSFSTFLGFTGATIAAVVIFLRFGYAYAAIAATVLLPLAVFDLEMADTPRRLVACALLFTVFFLARERREDHDPDHPADTFALVQAVAWAAMYFLANLKVSSLLSAPDEGVPMFYWGTYAVIWLMPFAGLVMAIRDRHRALLNVNIVLAIVTMLTNKAYLGAEPKPWDPILFGVLLIAIAIGVRRWLSSGPGGSRSGYIAERILASERDRLALAGSVTVLAPGAPAAHPHESPTFGGGESGGAGATGKF
jgi:hypothetical protein